MIKVDSGWVAVDYVINFFIFTLYALEYYKFDNFLILIQLRTDWSGVFAAEPEKARYQTIFR